MESGAMDAVIAAVSDIAIVVNSRGVIEDFSCNIRELAELGPRAMKGRALEDTVTEECRSKVREMIAAALAGEEARWREINHLLEKGGELPVRYQAIRAGEGVLFLGRELRAVAALQSRLVRAQRALDQDYGRLRQMETRYRVLFHTITEPLMIVDAETGRIQEANAAAGRLLGLDAQGLAGTPLAGIYAADERERIDESVRGLRLQGGSATILGRAEGGQSVELRATLFRASDAILVLCRLKAGEAGNEQDSAIEEMLITMIGRMSDAVVVTDLDGRILWCNEAFLSLAEIALEEHARGEPLARFLGRPGVDIDVILANARAHGHLRGFSAVVRGAFGSTTRVDISAAALADVHPIAVGFVMRDIARSDRSVERPAAAPADSVEHLMELVGSVPLKELVRASVDQVEKICIEAALQMTGNNRASAAEILGLSRQSLYVKLRRFDLLDSPDNG